MNPEKSIIHAPKIELRKQVSEMGGITKQPYSQISFAGALANSIFPSAPLGTYHSEIELFYW